MPKQTILITGGSGLLATNWANVIKQDYQVILSLHHKNISLSGTKTIKLPLVDSQNIEQTLKDNKINIVINTVGLTNVDLCEKQPELAQEVNVDTAKNIAIACANTNTKLVHISTDHLFDGNIAFATETTNTTPLNVYGNTKLAAEITVLAILPSALIIRTNFFGRGTHYRQSFSDTIITALKNNTKIDLFTDVYYTPILIDELVINVHKLIDINAHGIFNVVSNERISKYEFGLKTANIFQLDKTLIKPISINKKSSLTQRPKDMSLANNKLITTLKTTIPNLDKQITTLKQQKEDNTNKVKLSLIPYGKHYLDKTDINAVVQVLTDSALTQGPKVAEFENKVANYVGVKYAIAVSSGTAALHLAALTLDLGKDDGVISSPNTFVATSNAVLYVGAKPIFIDINQKTLNINIALLEQTIIDNPNVKAIFPVHFSGFACDMVKISTIAKKYNLAIVEDAAHALGATYKNGKKVGNCYYSDMTIFSFHPVKGIAAGEGGMITTNNKELYKKLLILRSHGITKGNFEFPGISIVDGTILNKNEALENGQLKRWYYEMQQLGFNYRITDIQCALAISQMDKIDLFLTRRRQLAKQYDNAFKNHTIIKPYYENDRENNSHHIYVVAINFKALKTTRNQFMTQLAKRGIGSQVHYIPVVSQPYYQNLGYNIDDYPATKKYYKNTLSIPLYYGLSNDEQNYIINALLALTQ